MLRVTNPTGSAMTGWFPFTVPTVGADSDWRDEARICPATDAVTGRSLEPVEVRYGTRIGSARCAWAKLDIEPAQHIHVDLAKGVGLDAHQLRIRAIDFAAPPELPPEMAGDPVRFFAPSINGLPLQIVANWQGQFVEADGPALRAHFRGRCGVATWADLFLAYVPGDPWLRFELQITCAHPEHGDVIVEQYPAGLDLKIGEAVVGFYGQRFGPVLVGSSLAQGQARAFAGFAAWMHKLQEGQDQQIAAMLTGSPFLVDARWRDLAGGIGCPDLPSGFRGGQFAAAMVGRWINTMHDWADNLTLGPAPNSGVTGAQEEQTFGAHGGEAFHSDPWSPAGVFVRYLVALYCSRRPCHWREASGEHLDFEGHRQPRLVFWSGQPHWHTGVSPDRLGLTRLPSGMETRGWGGPDREHWFYGSLIFAALVTGSRVLQLQLEAQSRLVWFGETVDPALSTSGAGSARGVGWFGILATGLLHALQDQRTKARVEQRARERVERVFLPSFGSHQFPERPMVWDPRSDARLLTDLRKHYEDIVLGDGTIIPTSPTLPPNAVRWREVYDWAQAWMVYQQSVGAFGLWLLGQTLGIQACTDAAVVAARTCFRAGWQQVNGQWTEWEILAVMPDGSWLPPHEYVERQGAHRTGWFRGSWMPLCVWLSAWAGDPEAMVLYQQLREEAASSTRPLVWLPPLERRPAPLPSIAQAGSWEGSA